jgi:hypothetical protein
MEKLKDLEAYPSATYQVKVGCGHLHVTVVYYEGKVYNVFIHRKSKAPQVKCDIIWFDGLQRQTTFQTRREMIQVIKDLRGNDDPVQGHYCQQFNIYLKGLIKKGKLAAYSCQDAVARVLYKEYEKNKLLED